MTHAGMLNSPFKWVGGKSRLRKFIIPMIPPIPAMLSHLLVPRGCSLANLKVTLRS